MYNYFLVNFLVNFLLLSVNLISTDEYQRRLNECIAKCNTVYSIAWIENRKGSGNCLFCVVDAGQSLSH